MKLDDKYNFYLCPVAQNLFPMRVTGKMVIIAFLNDRTFVYIDFFTTVFSTSFTVFTRFLKVHAILCTCL